MGTGTWVWVPVFIVMGTGTWVWVPVFMAIFNPGTCPRDYFGNFIILSLLHGVFQGQRAGVGVVGKSENRLRAVGYECETTDGYSIILS